MFRRVYLVLLFLRVYFALSPSYLHPDENFQGPEIFAGKISTRRAPPTAFHCGPLPKQLEVILTVTRNIRACLLVSGPSHLGVYLREPHPQRVPAMARLRLTHDPPQMALDRSRHGEHPAIPSILRSPGDHVRSELRARGLGDL